MKEPTLASRVFVPLVVVSLGFYVLSGTPKLIGAPTVVAPIALNQTAVITGNVAITAVSAGSAYNGCYIQNDPSNANVLIVDPVNNASVTSPSSTAAFINPGSAWNCPYATQTTVTVTAVDAGHKFYGIKF